MPLLNKYILCGGDLTSQSDSKYISELRCFEKKRTVVFLLSLYDYSVHC